MKKAVIYARYSCEKQTEQSIDGQLDVCTKYANENGFDVVGIYIDRATTATNDNRKEFQQMLADSALRKWEAVIVYKLDRFARNKYDSALNRKKLRDNGVRVISAMEDIPDTAEGILLESVLEGLNEYFSIELGQKVKRGLRESRKNGQFVGGNTPFGYKIVNKKYEIEYLEAEKVRQVFDLYLSGFSGKKIAKVLGFSSSNFVYSVIDNEKYIGTLRHDDEVFEDVIPAIVDKETFANAQRLRELNKHNRFQQKEEYPLAGKVFCLDCGKALRSSYSRSRHGYNVRYYLCTSPCPIRVNAERLENAILDEIQQAIMHHSAGIAQATIRALKDKRQENRSKELEKSLQAVNRKIDNLYKAVEQVGMTPEASKRLTALHTQQYEIERQIANANRIDNSAEQIKKYLKEFDIRENKDDVFRLLILRVETNGKTANVFLNNKKAVRGAKPDGLGVPRVISSAPNITVYCDLWVINCQIKKAP